MKILTFGDSHGDYQVHEFVLEQAKKETVDLIVCIGDVSLFGMHLPEIIEHLDKSEIPILMIHGNHEHESTLKKLVEESKNIKWIHKDVHIQDGFAFVGYGGGGFAHRDPEFVSFIKEHKNKKNMILLTHQPPYDTKLDPVGDLKTGSKDIKDAIKELQPILALSGHIHETFEEQEKLGDSLLLNPGPTGQIIDLEHDKKSKDKQDNSTE
jgi:Icc-related predicted phosphoesterase